MSRLPEERKYDDLTFEQREEKDRLRIKEIETVSQKDFPKCNYKWYEIGDKICIEIYEKGLL
jgi:hypothetical protein